MMEVTLQKLSPVLVEFDIQVAAERVKSELDKAYGQVARTARVPGFRPGKAPRRVLSHYYGLRVQADVVKRLIDETFPKALTEHQLQPVTEPAIEASKLVENAAFTYKARVEVLPTIDAVDYQGLSAERSKVTVTEEAVDQEIETLRRGQATLEEPKKARAARAGDVVTVDLKVEVDGQEISDVAASDLQIDLGSGQFLPEIEEGLTGKKAGETARIEVKMPDQHPHPRLKGRTASFTVEVKALKERVLPALDDELAKDLGDFESLSALKEDVKTRLEKQQKEAADTKLAEALVKSLCEKNPIPVPATLVEQQMRLTEQEILTRARSYGQEATGIGEELRKKLRSDSEVKVRAGLLMAEIAKKEALKISNEEIEEGLKELAEQSGKNIAKVRAEYADKKKREMLVGMILENKVLDIIEAKANIKES